MTIRPNKETMNKIKEDMQKDYCDRIRHYIKYKNNDILVFTVDIEIATGDIIAYTENFIGELDKVHRVKRKNILFTAI